MSESNESTCCGGNGHGHGGSPGDNGSCCGEQKSTEQKCCGSEATTDDHRCCKDQKDQTEGVDNGGCCQDKQAEESTCCGGMPVDADLAAQVDAAFQAPAVDYETQLRERTEDLQRLQAEYVNYKRRVDRDRDQARAAGIEAVVVDLLPVLDAIKLAAQHEELSGGFKSVADEIERMATKYGVQSYGEPGEIFDPQIHDALMVLPGEPGQTEPCVGQLIQAGYKIKERIVRHARVAVAEPVPTTETE